MGSHHTEPEPWVVHRVRALESLLIEKGLLSTEVVDKVVQTYEKDVGPMNGARVVARGVVVVDVAVQEAAQPALRGVLARGRHAARRLRQGLVQHRLDAPIVIEDPAFPAMKHFPIRFTIKDEIVPSLKFDQPGRLVRIHRALGDEKRIRILRAVASSNPTLQELVELFDIKNVATSAAGVFSPYIGVPCVSPK